MWLSATPDGLVTNLPTLIDLFYFIFYFQALLSFASCEIICSCTVFSSGLDLRIHSKMQISWWFYKSPLALPKVGPWLWASILQLQWLPVRMLKKFLLTLKKNTNFHSFGRKGSIIIGENWESTFLNFVLKLQCEYISAMSSISKFFSIIWAVFVQEKFLKSSWVESLAHLVFVERCTINMPK